MSRHRKVKAMDYGEEYDDYYGALDDDDDLDVDEGDFESKYLSSGIDLKIDESNNSSLKIEHSKRQQQQQHNNLRDTLPPATCSALTSDLTSNAEINLSFTPPAKPISKPDLGSLSQTTISTTCDTRRKPLFESVSSLDHSMDSDQSFKGNITPDLTRIAIQHLDKHQWQLPLMDMDKKFRDRTYYRHYSDYYISSLRSKLGHFLADNQMLQNPMRYHIQTEMDDHQKYSRMFDLLADYYQSLGGKFFSFATPSPDEEIVIGCRLGTKATKRQPREKALAKIEQKTARFEYSGTKTNGQAKQQKKAGDKSQDPSKQIAGTVAKAQNLHQNKSGPSSDMTIQEGHTAEQLHQLSEKYKESLRKAETKSSSSFERNVSTGGKRTTATAKPQAVSATAATVPQQKPKQLSTLTDKRKTLKDKIKQNAEPSAQELESFKLRAIQVTNEYNELMRSSRARLNLVVVGHVDAGKSTLVGHLLFKLGQINNKQMHRFEVDSQRSGKSSFKFAWALDETEEERARGVTIDIALTKFETAHKDIVMLDAPGHVDFIPAVISGAAQADAALLVVDATRGEFETGFTSGGQTREHTFLVRSLGVRSLIVVVNKMDTVNWNPHRFNDIVEQLKPFLKQVGFNLNDDVQFVGASGLTGENLTERRQDKLRKESSHPQLEQSFGHQLDQSPSLIEAIDRMKSPERMVDKPTRLCVTDVFKGMSSGVHLAGKLISGKLEMKQKLLLVPPTETCEVKSVETRSQESPNRSKSAYAGDLVSMTCTGVDLSKFYRGCILCDPVIPCNVTNRFQARIIMFQNADTILIKGAPIEVHINGAYESGQVRKLLSLLNKNTGELIQARPRCVARNASAIIQLKLERVVCCELYESNKDLGRFMMRSYGKTIAAGLITKIKSAKVKKSGGTKMKSKG